MNRELVGKYVMIEVDGLLKRLVVTDARNFQPVKRLNLKGVYNCEMSFEDYLVTITREPRSERRLASFRAVTQAA